MKKSTEVALMPALFSMVVLPKYKNNSFFLCKGNKMTPWRLTALLPLAYIVWWIYALITSIIPWLNVAVGDSLSLTWLQIAGTILFFTFGVVGLIICFVFLAAILFA